MKHPFSAVPPETVRPEGSLAAWLERQNGAWDRYRKENPVPVPRKTGRDKGIPSEEKPFREWFRDREQIPGTAGSSGSDPSDGYDLAETAGLFRTLGVLLRVTKKGEYGDRMEKIVYNALPGAVMSGGSGFQRISAANQTVSGSFSHPGPFSQAHFRQYRMDPETAPRVFGILPDFIRRLWMTDGGSPAAVLYGPSRFSGTDCTVSEETEYPFDGKILFRWEEASGKSFPFTFRIPGWCEKAEVRLNGERLDLPLRPGKFVKIRRLWKKGDALKLFFPMDCVQETGRFHSRVRRGPLVFVLPLELRSTRTGKGTFAPWDLSTPELWNWGMAPGTKFRVLTPETGCPDPWLEPPVLVRASLFPVTGFDALEQGRFTPRLPLFSGPAGAEREKTLVPFGCTSLRIAAFPDGVKREPVCCTGAVFLRSPGKEPEKKNFSRLFSAAKEFPCGTDGRCSLSGLFSPRKKEAVILFRIGESRPGKAAFRLTAAGETEAFLNGKKVFHGAADGWFGGTLRKKNNFLMLKIRKPGPCPKTGVEILSAGEMSMN